MTKVELQEAYDKQTSDYGLCRAALAEARENCDEAKRERGRFQVQVDDLKKEHRMERLQLMIEYKTLAKAFRDIIQRGLQGEFTDAHSWLGQRKST